MSSVVVPHRDLPKDVLQNLMESFVSRDGTDYGLEEVGLDERVARLKRELDVGRALIVFDQDSESVNIVTADAWRRMQRHLDA